MADAAHPMLRGVPADWPLLLGYNRVAAKPDSELIARIGDDPLLVAGSFGNGRGVAFTSDCGPHWAPPPFVDWTGYAPLWNGIAEWRGVPMIEVRQPPDPWQRTTTAHGLAADEVISALQKCIRRGITDNALLLGWEMYVTSPEMEGDAVVAALRHFGEDVGLGNAQAPVLVETLFQMHQRYPRPEHDRFMFAAHAIRVMAGGQKDRTTDEMASWAKQSITLGERLPEIPDFASTCIPNAASRWAATIAGSSPRPRASSPKSPTRTRPIGSGSSMHSTPEAELMGRGVSVLGIFVADLALRAGRLPDIGETLAGGPRSRWGRAARARTRPSRRRGSARR